jgi:hypothetical protein
VVLGLAREELIEGNTWGYGKRHLSDATGLPAVSFHPSPLGAELFLWGAGSADLDQAHLFDPGLELIPSDSIPPLTLSSLGSEDEEIDAEDMRLHGIWMNREFDKLKILARKFCERFPNVLNGYFYLAQVYVFEDFEGAKSQMEKASEMSNEQRRKGGLLTIDEAMIHFPRMFDELLELGRILQAPPE